MADIVTRLVMMGSTRYHVPAFHRHVLARLHNFLWTDERTNWPTELTINKLSKLDNICDLMNKMVLNWRFK